MNVKKIISEHFYNVEEEQEGFINLIKEETKNLSKAQTSVEIIKGIIEDYEKDGLKGWFRQVFKCNGNDPTIEYVYYDYDRNIMINVDYANGYIDLLGLTSEEYDDVKQLLTGIIKCEW